MKGKSMGLFDFLLGNESENEKNRRYHRQEMANMDEFGWDEIEETKCDLKSLQQEKFANYEYSDEKEE